MEWVPGVPQYLFDDGLIASQQRLVRRWLPATVHPWPVIVPDCPWEGRMPVLYGTLLPGPKGGYWLYYGSFTPGAEPAKVLLAVSDDGWHWHKPELGLVEWRGSRANNIVLAPTWTGDSPSLIYDPQDADHPYKMIIFHADDRARPWGPGWGLYAYLSADGLNWERMPGPCLRAGDRTNLMATRPEGRYVVYTRHPEMMTRVGARAIYRSSSPDLIQWDEPELVLAPDLADEPDVEYYGMSVFQRHGWYLGLLEYWRADQDVIETVLAVSRDGVQWSVPVPRAPLIAGTCDWNRTWSTCASNGPLVVNEQMVFFLGGRWTSHHYDSAQQYAAIGYASLPLDRFCALEATTEGELVTVPLTWVGGDLALNADTRESFRSHPAYTNGEIAVEVLDAAGQPMPGWSGEARAIFHGNTHSRARIDPGIVRWVDGRSLDLLRGQVIRLRLHLAHARLYTLMSQN